MRDTTIFYRSYYEAISQIEAKDERLIIYEAILEYSLNLVEPQLVGIPKTVFTLIKPTLDSCIKNYRNGSKPKRDRSETEAKDKPNGSQTEAYKDKDKDKDTKGASEAKIEIKHPFENFWNLYDKKRGDKEKIEKKWRKLTDSDREAIMSYIPKYKSSQPDKKYRKDPDTFLNNKAWKDELIESESVGEILPKSNGLPEVNMNDFFGTR